MLQLKYGTTPEMAPIRVLSRICYNAVIASVYLSFSLVVTTVMSERPFVSSGDLWRYPYEHTQYTRAPDVARTSAPLRWWRTSRRARASARAWIYLAAGG